MGILQDKGAGTEARELDGILDKEYGNVVADNIPVALVSVELDREATHIATSIIFPSLLAASRLSGCDNEVSKCCAMTGRLIRITGSPAESPSQFRIV
jgi:hypothetical protein